MRPRAIIFDSTSRNDSETYMTKILEEVNRVHWLSPNDSLHNTIAIIVSDEGTRDSLLNAGLRSHIDKASFRAVTAMQASERYSNDPPEDGKGHIIVDSIGNMNGMERLFVIVVDMDKPLEKKIEEYIEPDWKKKNKEIEEKNQNNLSEIYCACTRGMLYISFENKHIGNGWMSFFNFTESVTESSSMREIEKGLESYGIDTTPFKAGETLRTEKKGRIDTESFPNQPSSILKRGDHRMKMDDIPLGVANDICHGEVRYVSSYERTSSKVMARTSIFDISKMNLDSAKDIDVPIPTFNPLNLCGMSEYYPFIYEGGVAPKVPFIVISPNVDKIQNDAFRCNDLIVRLVFPKQVTVLGEGAPRQCSELKFLVFEQGSLLHSIGCAAFMECEKIEVMELPPSLERLGVWAFKLCLGLKKVTLSPKMTTIKDRTFVSCSPLIAVDGIHTIQWIEWYAFFGCSSLAAIDINSEAHIHDRAFNNCTAVITRI